MPDQQKPMSDLEYLRQLDPRSLRDYLKDGNYGGCYQREDEEMMKIWRAGVAETRELLELGRQHDPASCHSERIRPSGSDRGISK